MNIDPAEVGALTESMLWQRLRGSGDQAARAALMELHLPYAQVVAASYYSRRMHDEIEFADYHQLACVGLLEALDRYDPARGFQFRTFAARRMHGAILDGLKSATEKQQQIAARQRLLHERHAEIRQSARDSARARGGFGARTDDQLLEYIAEVGIAFALAWLMEGTGMIDSRAEPVQDMPFYRHVEVRQMRERVADAVASMPEQERTVIQRHYFQEIPFTEIAASLGLTRGRVSQIHRQGLERLKECLRGEIGALAA